MTRMRPLFASLLLVVDSACGTDLLKVETINPAPTQKVRFVFSPCTHQLSRGTMITPAATQG